MNPASPQSLTGTSVLKICDDVSLIPIGEDAILYRESTGRLHTVNPSGAHVCALLDGSTTVETIANLATEAYGLAQIPARSEIEAFLTDLVVRGLVVHSSPEPRRVSS